MYKTVNEGNQHVPRFRSTVSEDCKSYTNEVSFLYRKAAEQDATRLALESVPIVMKDVTNPLVLEVIMLIRNLLSGRMFLPDMLEHTLYKNRLQEFTQKSSIPLPMYKTINEGNQHVPKFRSTVSVDGKSHTNQVSYLYQRTVAQDAVRLALESLPIVMKDVANPLVLEKRPDTVRTQVWHGQPQAQHTPSCSSRQLSGGVCALGGEPSTRPNQQAPGQFKVSTVKVAQAGA
ncbi:unnamed protein product [Lupinus luteus]|uniref:DRBM domain-containing protein n=1 Tax=Lupinus luteus TaxID=3873 RepID=A0AAV1WPM0_LUPLU